MNIRLLVTVIDQDRLYRKGAVLNLGPLENARWVHDRVAVPEPEAPKRQVIHPEEQRRCHG